LRASYTKLIRQTCRRKASLSMDGQRFCFTGPETNNGLPSLQRRDSLVRVVCGHRSHRSHGRRLGRHCLGFSFGIKGTLKIAKTDCLGNPYEATDDIECNNRCGGHDDGYNQVYDHYQEPIRRLLTMHSQHSVSHQF
jgi:hypothetical protein